MADEEKQLATFEIVDNMLIGTYLARNVDLKVAEQVTEERHKFTQGKKYPVLVDYRMVTNTTKEARDYFCTEYAYKDLTAMAVLIDSPVGKIISAFFYQIMKPPYTLKIFNNKAKAIKWLKQYC